MFDAGRRFRQQLIGPDHPGPRASVAIHLPRHGVLFTGDTIADAGSVTLGVFNQDRAKTMTSFQWLSALDVETACFGHGEPIATRGGERIREVAAKLSH